MLEKPDLADEKIVACLQAAYGLSVTEVMFLPLGADENTAVYHITTDATAYFLKLRSGVFDEPSVLLPKFLSDQGIRQIIPPLATETGQHWADLGGFKVILYPFVAGQNGYERPLTDDNWRELGATLRRLHTAVLPPTLVHHIRRETFSPQWRDVVREALALWVTAVYDDPIARSCAAFLQSKRTQIADLVERTERLAQAIQADAPAFTLCHADIHAGNVLTSDDAFYIVDWDTLIFAPKERDLMFAGAGLFGHGRTPTQEETLFYQGYGPTEVNPATLAYYRYERIIEDMAIYCQQLLLSSDGGADRAQSLHYLQSNFLSGGTIEAADRAFTGGTI